MASIKISELEEVTKLSTSDVLPIINENKTKKVSLEKLNEILGGNGGEVDFGIEILDIPGSLKSDSSGGNPNSYHTDAATCELLSNYINSCKDKQLQSIIVKYGPELQFAGVFSPLFGASTVNTSITLYKLNTSMKDARYADIATQTGTVAYFCDEITLYIKGTWTNGVYSCTGYCVHNTIRNIITQSYVDEKTLLKTNTTAFTPTGDYNPATKKYVDDAVANSGGGSGVDYPHLLDYTIPINMNRYGLIRDWQNGMQVLTNIASKFSDFVNKAYNYCSSGGDPMNIVLSLVFNRVTEYTDEIQPPIVKCYPSTYDLTPFTEQHNIYYLDSEIFSGYTINSNFTNIKKRQFYVHIEGTWDNGVFTCTNPRLYIRWTTKEGLPTDNTTAYTPSKDYHPATKKYVDDAVKNAITSVLEAEY